MNVNRNYKRQANADFPAYMRRMGKARSVSPPARLIRRLRCSVIETDWDRDLWGLEKWIDLFCWTVIAFSLLFIIPVTLSVLWK
jgi:hypothetical protein